MRGRAPRGLGAMAAPAAADARLARALETARELAAVNELLARHLEEAEEQASQLQTYARRYADMLDERAGAHYAAVLAKRAFWEWARNVPSTAVWHMRLQKAAAWVRDGEIDANEHALRAFRRLCSRRTLAAWRDVVQGRKAGAAVHAAVAAAAWRVAGAFAVWRRALRGARARRRVAERGADVRRAARVTEALAAWRRVSHGERAVRRAILLLRDEAYARLRGIVTTAWRDLAAAAHHAGVAVARASARRRRRTAYLVLFAWCWLARESRAMRHGAAAVRRVLEGAGHLAAPKRLLAC